jgi:hypothetical protein
MLPLFSFIIFYVKKGYQLKYSKHQTELGRKIAFEGKSSNQFLIKKELMTIQYDVKQYNLDSHFR